jgi:hypothetical protein
MTNHGAMTLPIEILSLQDSPVVLIRSCVGMMRNLCADDKRKNRLVSDGSLRLMIVAMSKKEYASDFLLMDHAIACLAQMSLRSPSNSSRIVECGAIEILVKTMHAYPDKSNLLRQACLCIRNIAARCVELRDILLDAGVETVLRAAGRHVDAVDEAYAALRDLGCEVQCIKINAETGEVGAAYETFGSTKSAFNPVYDSATDIADRVQDEAKAPFALDLEDDNDDNIEDRDFPNQNNNIKDSCGSGVCHDHSHSHDHSHE